MYSIQKFKFARYALEALITGYSIKEIYLPYYLCDVIRHFVVKAGAKPLFYHIDDNFMPVRNFPQESYILYPNYFGICDSNVKKLVETYPKLIVDNAHSFFSKPSGCACFYAEHKFFPIKFGAYLLIKKEGASGEKTLPKTPSYYNISRNKFKIFYNKYKDSNLLDFDIRNAQSPFCYPYLAQTDEAADNFAKELTSQGLNIYRYWNPLPKSYNEYKFYRRLVPIPIIDN